MRTVALVLGCLLLVACGQQSTEPPDPVPRPVRIVAAGSGADRLLTLPGTLEAWESVQLAFEVSGRVVELPVLEGQQVAAGAVLARIDARDYRSRLEAAEAQLTQAESELARAKELLERGALAQAAFDQRQAAATAARASRDQAAKAVEEATIIAPFDGQVARVLVQAQATVQPKQPVLVLQDISRLKVSVDVPETLIAKARPGLSLAERSAAIRPEVVVSSIPGRSWPCTIHELAGEPDPATRTYRCTFVLDNPDDVLLMPGMSAGVRGREQAISGGFTVPLSAVVGDIDGQAAVWIADPATLTVTRRRVELGTPGDGRVTVVAGLTAGDLVVETGVAWLQEGMEVRRLSGE